MNHNKRKFRGVLSGFMATALTASLLPLPEAKASAYFTDITQDWYRDAVTRWATYGVVSGKLDNEFRPDEPIKRGEMAIMLDQVMGYEKTSDSLFTDLLDPTKWYFTALQKANAAGVMDGLTTTTMGPEGYVTREAAALMLYKAFHLNDAENTNTSTNTTYNDNGSITYGKEAVIKLTELGVVSGRDDNLFDPFGNVTRAEFCVMLNKMVSTFQKTATTSSVSPTATGTYVVRSGEVNLTNMTIPGDLILTEGISEGDVTLTNVTIGGNLYVQGGGVESIYLNDVTLEGNLQVDRQMAPVRVVFGGKTQAPNVAVKNSCILDASTLGTDGLVGDVLVSNAETVTLLGTISSLTNKCVGTEYTINEANIAAIHFESSGIINGVAVAAGSSFDSNSIPNVDLTEPEITLYHDYGSAEDDEDNEPYAESTVSSLTFDQSTGEVVATIQVINEEDCVLMSEALNAITVHNPNNLASLEALELDVTKKTTTNTTEFTVTFTMTQNYSEVPLSVNFKDENAEPEVTVEANFNGISSASANLEVVEVSMSGTGTVTANLEVDSIKFCEPHYMDKYVLTTETDIEFIVDSDYDVDESFAEYEIQFESSEVDNIHFTLNFLKMDAQEEIPKIYTDVYDEEESKASGSSVDVEDLYINAQGLVQVELKLDLDPAYMVLSNLSKAVTILANSDEPQYGYGLDFDVSVKHEGAYSYYTITFVPDSDITDVCFVVNVEDASDNFPTMNVESNMVRMEDVDTYFVINQNTRTYSKTYVSVQVSVDEEALLEKYEGFVLDTSDLFTVLYEDNAKATGTLTEVEDFSFSKVEDGLYEIKFKPVSYTVSEGEGEEELYDHILRLNLEQDDDYVALVPVDNVGAIKPDVAVNNLKYAVEATENTSTDEELAKYSHKITFNVKLDGAEENPAITQPKYPNGLEADDDGYDPTTAADDPTLNPLDQGTEDSQGRKGYTVVYGTNVTSGVQQVTVYFETAFRCDPEDVVFYVGGVSVVPPAEDEDTDPEPETEYEEPTVALDLKIGNDDASANYDPEVVEFDPKSGIGKIQIDLGTDKLYTIDKVNIEDSEMTSGYTYSLGVLTIPFTWESEEASEIPITLKLTDISLVIDTKVVDLNDGSVDDINFDVTQTYTGGKYSIGCKNITGADDPEQYYFTYKIGDGTETAIPSDGISLSFDAEKGNKITVTLYLAHKAPVLTKADFTAAYSDLTGSEFHGEDDDFVSPYEFTITDNKTGTKETSDATDYTITVERASASTQLVWEYASTDGGEINFKSDVTATLSQSESNTKTLYVKTTAENSTTWKELGSELTVDSTQTSGIITLSYNELGTNPVTVQLVGFEDTAPAEGGSDVFLFTAEAVKDTTLGGLGTSHNEVRGLVCGTFLNFMIGSDSAVLIPATDSGLVISGVNGELRGAKTLHVFVENGKSLMFADNTRSFRFININSQATLYVNEKKYINQSVDAIKISEIAVSNEGVVSFKDKEGTPMTSNPFETTPAS